MAGFDFAGLIDADSIDGDEVGLAGEADAWVEAAGAVWVLAGLGEAGVLVEEVVVCAGEAGVCFSADEAPEDRALERDAEVVLELVAVDAELALQVGQRELAGLGSVLEHAEVGEGDQARRAGLADALEGAEGAVGAQTQSADRLAGPVDQHEALGAREAPSVLADEAVVRLAGGRETGLGEERVAGLAGETALAAAEGAVAVEVGAGRQQQVDSVESGRARVAEALALGVAVHEEPGVALRALRRNSAGAAVLRTRRRPALRVVRADEEAGGADLAGGRGPALVAVGGTDRRPALGGGGEVVVRGTGRAGGGRLAERAAGGTDRGPTGPVRRVSVERVVALHAGRGGLAEGAVPQRTRVRPALPVRRVQAEPRTARLARRRLATSVAVRQSTSARPTLPVRRVQVEPTGARTANPRSLTREAMRPRTHTRPTSPVRRVHVETSSTTLAHTRRSASHAVRF